MDNLFNPIAKLFRPVQSVPPGIYHYQAPQADPRNYRLHLRVEEDGSGVLIVNAATVLHLNQSATEYAYYFIQNMSAGEAASKMSRRYRINAEKARQDYENFTGRVLTLVETPDLDPVTFLDFDRQHPYSGKISAPYRLDCAITYRLPDGADQAAAPVKRVDRELLSAEWQVILDKAWQAGIPHVVFTGGEPTLRDDLPNLIAHAESLGQVSGLLTDGLRLAEETYLQVLLQTGLDHLMIDFQPSNELAWKALENIRRADIFDAVHLTLTPENSATLPDLLHKLAENRLQALSLSCSEPALADQLTSLRNLAASLQMELIWDLPVPYSTQNPVSLEVQDQKLPEGAGRAWLYVEPDGDVLPTQGANQVLGNMLKDPWEKIWKPG